MRWGRLLAWIAVLGIVGVFWTINLSAQPDEILLDNKSEFTSRQRPAVKFPHLAHMEADIECSSCHHRFKNGENQVDDSELEEGEEGIKCASCHRRKTGFKFKPELDPTKRNLMQAYHRMCMGCHRQLKKDNKAAGAVTCGECHPRKKAAAK